MSIDRVVDLKALHLYGMATAWSEWLAEFAHQPKPVIPKIAGVKAICCLLYTSPSPRD